VLAAAGLVGALALRRPELAIAAAPFALLLVLGTMTAAPPSIDVELELERDRTLEGAEVAATLRVTSERAIDRLEVLLELPAEVEVVDGDAALALRVRRHDVREVPIRLRCTRWGVHEVGRIRARARDRLRVVVWDGQFARPTSLKAYPRPETISAILAPVETQAFTGSEVARVKGEGIEYADIRDFVPGDRLRAINWRASARRGSLVVNERHPERNTDVVLFLDSFVELRAGGRSTLDDAVRAAATIATRYLERRDRVGLVAFGGLLKWLEPGMGTTQRYRLIETLLETDVAPTYTWRDVNLIPAGILPPKALVVALTPLVDARFVTTLENLRARGFDLVVVEIDPVQLVRPGRAEVESLAYRLWLLERVALRGRLTRLGIGVARWSDTTSLEEALEGVRTYRRHARLARV